MNSVLIITMIMLVTKEVEASEETGSAPQSQEWFRRLVEHSKNQEAKGK